jgi:thiol peroxidase
MAQITLKGNPVNTVGSLPTVGSAAPAFDFVKTDLSHVTLDDLKGKKVVLNIFPSIDTPVCATSVRTFNEKAAGVDGAVVLNVSRDLPFAHKRFCGAEGIEKVDSVSTFRSGSFGDDYGVTMSDGAIAGLYSRAIVVIDGEGKVAYTEQVPEIAQEPNYEQALAALA